VVLLDGQIRIVEFASLSMLAKNLLERESTVSSSCMTGICKGACQVASSDIRKARFQGIPCHGVQHNKNLHAIFF
jgi:hypothetical protein